MQLQTNSVMLQKASKGPCRYLCPHDETVLKVRSRPSERMYCRADNVEDGSMLWLLNDCKARVGQKS